MTNTSTNDNKQYVVITNAKNTKHVNKSTNNSNTCTTNATNTQNK